MAKKGLKNFLENLVDLDEIKRISSDGFQAKDIVDYGKLIAKTEEEGLRAVTRGILNTGENIGDFAAYHTASGLQKLGIAPEYMEEVKRATTDTSYNKITNDLLAPTGNKSMLGTSGQNVLEGVGNSLGNMAIGGKFGGGATYGSMFVSSAGAATTQKYGEIDKTLQQLEFQKSIATDKDTKDRLQAEIDNLSKNKDKYINTYATISGLAEMGSEAMFGGIAKGLKIRGIGTGSEDDLIRYATKNMSSMLARNLTAMGISAVGEGFEEIASDFGEALAQKASTEKDKSLTELLADQDWLGDFMNGFMSSLITQGGETIHATKQGVNLTTGLTETEENVIKELAKETKENGDNRKTSEIEREIEDKLKEGSIKVEDIQRILSKDTYNELQELKTKRNDIITKINENNAKIKEYDADNNLKAQNLTDYHNRLIENENLERDLAQDENLSKAKLDEITQRLENETYELVKGKDGNISSAFNQSYLDKQNRSQAYQIDEKTYEKADDNTKRLYDSAKRVMNNTVESRKFVNALSKLSKSNGLNYEFTNNKELKELGKIMDGKIINGYAYRTDNGNTVMLNADMIEDPRTVVGHEITHFTETSKNYKDYQKFLKDNFADEYNALKEKYKELYKGMNADIDSEVTAQLTGEKLFSDNDFIEKLTQKPTLFNKIKNFIDSLVEAFSGTKEEKKLRELQKKFQDVYNKTDFSAIKEDTEYSLLEDNQDSSNNEVNDYVKEKGYTFKNNGILEVNNLTDKQIKDLVKIYKTTGYEDVSTDYLIDRLKSGQMPLQREIADRFIEKELGHKPQYDTTKIFEDSEGNQLTQEQVEFFKDSDVRDIRGRLIPVYHRTDADFTVFDPNAGTQHGKKYGKGLYFSIVPENYGNNTIKAYLNAKEGEYKYVPKMGYYIVQEPNQIKRTDNLKPTSNPDIRYSLSTTEEMEKYNNDRKDVFRQLDKDFGGGVAIWEANLDGRDYEDSVRYLKQRDSIKRKFAEENNIEVKDVMKPVEYRVAGNRSEEVQNYIRNNNITMDKLINDPEVQKEYFNQLEKAMLQDEWTQEEIDDYLSKFNDYFENQRTRRNNEDVIWPLLRFKGDIENILEGNTEVVDSIETAKLERELIDDNPKFDKYVKKYADRLFNTKPQLDPEDVMDEAKFNHGTTDDYSTGAYMTTDGSLLDFNSHGYRDDHRTIDAFDLSLQEFMDYGAIRMQPEGNGFEISVEPTQAQYDRLSDYIDSYLKTHGDKIYVDCGKEGRVYESDTSTSKIIDDIQYFFRNGNFPRQSEFAEFYSLSNSTDSNGNKLSLQQQDYFKDSKVRDENGNLMVMYHGTPNGEFTVFRPGSYFSPNQEYASGYQNTWASSISSGKVETTPRTYEVYLNIKNPFSLQDETAKRIYLDEYVKGGNSMYLDPYSDYTDYVNGLEELDWTEGEDFKEWLQENHPEYDGLILDEGGDGGYGEAEYRWRGKSYLPFNSNQIKNVDNLTPTEDPDIRYSISSVNDQPKPGQLNMRDLVRQQNEIAPTRQEESMWKGNEDELIAPVRNNLTPEESQELDELENLESKGLELDEDVARREQLQQLENTDYSELSPTTSLEDIRDYDSIGKRNVKAYQYEHPEVKPYFQAEAREMLRELDNSIKAEKYAIPDETKNIGDWEWVGIKRQISDDLAALLDGDRGFKYDRAEIRKGLKAIIEDHGNENIAVAKRLEFYIDERLRNGYDVWGAIDENGEQVHVPADQDYLNFLREQEWNNYYDSIPYGYLDNIAPTKDVELNADIERDNTPERLVVDLAPIPEGKGKSSYWQNVGKQDFLTEESKELIQDEDDVKYYDVVSNKETLEKAQKKLQQGGVDEALNWSNKFQLDKNGKVKSKVTAEDVAEGWILMKQYQDSGNYDAMIQVAKTMRNMGTEAGQAVQAYNIMSRMTPEGMVKYAQSELTEAFDKASKNKSKEWIDTNSEQFDLTPDETKFIVDTMNEVQNMEDGYEKKVKLAQIQKLISDKLPTNIGNEIKSWMRISMLFNPKTQVRNVAGNAIITPVNAISDLFASAADKFISRKSGVRTTGNMNIKAYLEGLKRGAYEATNDYKLGINTKDVNMDRFEAGQGKSFTEKTAIGKALNKTEGLLNYVMDVGDRIFSEAAFENSLQNQMILNNTTEVTQEMIDIARTEALQRTWNDNNNYTKFVLDIRKGLNKLNFKGYGLGDVLIPFAKTPANLTKAIVDYSPVGVVKALNSYRNLQNSFNNGQYNAQLQHEFVQTLGKATAGTLLYVLGYALAKAGISSGKADEDKDVSNFMKNTLGISNYSINIGGKSYTYDWAQPIAAPLSITANMVSSKDDKQALLESIVANLDTAGSILMEQSFLQSINDTLNNNSGFVNGLIDETLELPSRAIPTFSKQIADLVDDTQRQTYEYNRPVQSAINKMKSKIPGLSEDLAPVVDTMGREVKKYGGKNNLFNVFLNPANVNTENISESASEIYRLYKATNDKTIMPRVAPYYDGKGDDKIVLTPQQKAEYQTISGNIIETQVQELMKNADYRKMSDTDKAAVVKNIVDYSYNVAKHDVLGTDLSNLYEKAYLYSKVGNVNDWYLLKSQEFVADKDSNGKSISGSKKQKVVRYVDSMNISTIDKAILLEMNNYNVKEYEDDIYLYINNLNISVEDKKALLQKMGITQ